MIGLFDDIEATDKGKKVALLAVVLLLVSFVFVVIV